MTQTFSKGSPYKRPAVWEQPDVLRQFQEHVLETTKNAFSLEDTKRRVAHNTSYVSFMRKGRTAKEQADATRNETDDNVNLGMHPYRYGNGMQALSIWAWILTGTAMKCRQYTNCTSCRLPSELACALIYKSLSSTITEQQGEGYNLVSQASCTHLPQ